MGKRKTKRKPQARIKPKLETQFNCLFCNHEKSVTAKLNKSAGIGEIKCRVCQITWQTNITPLSHAIDVYSDWIDACEENNRAGAAAPPPAADAGPAMYIDPASGRGREFEEGYDDQGPTPAGEEGEGDEETEEVDTEDWERYRSLDAKPRSAARSAPPRQVEGNDEDEEEHDEEDVGGVRRAGTSASSREQHQKQDDDDEEEEPAVGSRSRRITHYFGSDEDEDEDKD